MNSSNRNKTRQTFINNKLHTQINKLIDTSNVLTNQVKKNNNIKMEVILNLQTKLRLIKEEIINIKQVLQYAKINILNIILLNKQEMQIALDNIK